MKEENSSEVKLNQYVLFQTMGAMILWIHDKEHKISVIETAKINEGRKSSKVK